jgi:DNA-binding NarL/FixJ family response regulator
MTTSRLPVAKSRIFVTSGGNRNRDIAQKLLITEETVKARLKRIMGKLRPIIVHSRSPLPVGAE